MSSTTARRSFPEKPFSRPPIAKLAARRFTSHSHGPGAVSSKSFMSKTSVRSGEPNTPKFDRWASPHSCTRRPECRRLRQIRRHDQRAAAVEGKRRRQHAAVADRHQLGHPRGRLLLQQRDRVTTLGEVDLRLRRARHFRSRRLAPRRPLLAREMRRRLLGSGRLRCPRGTLRDLCASVPHVTLSFQFL